MLNKTLIKHKSIFLVLLFFIKSTTIFAQNYELLYKKLEGDLLLGNFGVVIRLVDSINADKNLTKIISNDFTTLKVVALSKNNNLTSSLKLINQTLLNPQEINERSLVRLYLAKALILEIYNKREASELEFKKVENIYKTRPKDRLYGQYLYRKASYFRVMKAIKNNDSLSLIYVNKGIKFGEENKFYEVSATSKMILAFLAEKESQDQRTFLLKNSLKDFLLSKNQLNISNMYKNIGFHLLYNNKLDEADKYLDSSLFIIKKRKDLQVLSWLYEAKSKLNQKLKRIDSALFYYKKFHENEMLKNDKKQEREISLINYKNQIEGEKQKSIVSKNLLEETEKKNKILFFFIIGVILLSIFIGLLYRRLNKRKKKIDIQNSLLEENITKKEILLKELNHRVKNNLSLIISLIKFQSQEIKEQFYKEKFKHLENRINTIAIAHEQFIYSDTKTAGEFYNLEEYLQKIAGLVNVSSRNVKYVQNIVAIQLNIDTALPIGILINELISNSIEHAVSKNPLIINVQIKKKRNLIYITYVDSGTIFSKDSKKDTLGLFIIESMVAQLNGKIEREKSTFKIVLEHKN